VSQEPLLERLGQLEAAVRRATETIARLRDENARMVAERRQVLNHVDSILKDLARLDDKA
jgi:predicted nuclease with TOPRIM domain